MTKKYTVSDGKLVLTLEPMAEGGYLVRSPMDPELVTSAKDVPEAFAMARDALRGLRESRKKWVAQTRVARAS
jgi:predicted RNase H-like HicB family nuclease